MDLFLYIIIILNAYKHKYALFLVTKSKLLYEQIDIMALFSNLRRNRHFHNAVWGRGSTNKELAHGLVSRRRQRKVVDKGHYLLHPYRPRYTARCPNNGALWKERWCPLGVHIFQSAY